MGSLFFSKRARKAFFVERKRMEGQLKKAKMKLV
jgi:hypothetical protein